MLIPTENNSGPYLEEETSIDLRQYLSLLRQWWWLVLLVTLIAGGAAYALSLQVTPIYRASTTLLINEAPSNKATDYTSIITSERLAKTYAEMMVRRPVLEQVVNRLGISYTADQLAGMVSVNPVTDTQLLTITVESPSASLSALVANDLVAVFSDQLRNTETSRFSASKENLQKQISDAEAQIAQIRAQMAATQDPDETARLETRLNQYEQIYTSLVVSYEQVRTTEAQSASNVEMIESAVANPVPVKPQMMQNTILAAFVGMLLAVGSILLIGSFDETVKSPEEVQRKLNLPVMAVVVHYEEPKDGSLITQYQPRSPVTEAFRALRTNVQYAVIDSPLRSLLITSPTPSDGKTTIAANLAVVMAQGGRQVTLIDTDMHHPSVHGLFHLDYRPGLSELFTRQEAQITVELQPTQVETLHVLSTGKMPPNPSELLGSNKMRDILEIIEKDSDMVVIDAPPVLSVIDAVALAPAVDGVLLVVRPGRTHMSGLKHAVDQLRHVGATIVGVVFNDVNPSAPQYGYYYKSYDYYSTYHYGSNGHKNLNGKNGHKGLLKKKESAKQAEE